MSPLLCPLAPPSRVIPAARIIQAPLDTVCPKRKQMSTSLYLKKKKDNTGKKSKKCLSSEPLFHFKLIFFYFSWVVCGWEIEIYLFLFKIPFCSVLFSMWCFSVLSCDEGELLSRQFTITVLHDERNGGRGKNSHYQTISQERNMTTSSSAPHERKHRFNEMEDFFFCFVLNSTLRHELINPH